MTEDSPYICDRCKAELMFVCYDGHVLIRPRRMRDCRNYRAGFSSRVCQGLGDSKEGAVMAFEHLTLAPKEQK